MRKVKIAQIGTSKNSHGNKIWNSLKKQDNIFEIAGYAMPENEKEKFSVCLSAFEGCREMSVDEILNHPDIEAVAVETEEKYLTKYAVLAAKHGKHIHMEKPGGTDLRDFEALIRIAKENQTVFHTGYMYRYNPYVMGLMQEIKSGELGKIISVEAQMNCFHQKEVRQWLSGYPGGIMFFLGCHLIDLILQIQGIPDKIIPLSCSTGVDSVHSDDFGMAVFQYKNGVSFAKVNAVEHGGYMRRQLVVTGTKKTVEIKPFEIDEPGGMYTQKTEYLSEDWNDAGTTGRCDTFDRYDNMMRSFAAMVRGEKENPWTYDYELELYKTILSACKRGE